MLCLHPERQLIWDENLELNPAPQILHFRPCLRVQFLILLTRWCCLLKWNDGFCYRHDFLGWQIENQHVLYFSGKITDWSVTLKFKLASFLEDNVLKVKEKITNFGIWHSAWKICVFPYHSLQAEMIGTINTAFSIVAFLRTPDNSEQRWWQMWTWKRITVFLCY